MGPYHQQRHMNRGQLMGGGDKWGNIPELNPRQVQEMRDQLAEKGGRDPMKDLEWRWPDVDRVTFWIMSVFFCAGMFGMFWSKMIKRGTIAQQLSAAELRLASAMEGHTEASAAGPGPLAIPKPEKS